VHTHPDATPKTPALVDGNHQVLQSYFRVAGALAPLPLPVRQNPQLYDTKLNPSIEAGARSEGRRLNAKFIIHDSSFSLLPIVVQFLIAYK
jgi:hypothetical protein